MTIRKVDLSSSTSTLSLIVILGLIFGLQIIMVGPLSVGISTTPFSIAFRALMLLVSIYLCARVLLFPKLFELDRGIFWLLVFFIIYSARFIYDLYILEIDISPRLGGSSRLSQMMYGSIIIPLLGISIVRIKKENIGKWIFYASLFQSIAILFIFFFLYGASLQAFVSRYYVATIFEEFDLGNPISPIVISRAGGILAFCSILVRDVNKWFKFLCFGLGVMLLLLGSSRGPLIAFIFCFIIIGYNYIRKGEFEAIALKIIGIAMLTGVLLFAADHYVENINLGSVNRLKGVLESSGKGEQRLYTWTAAWEQFKSSPIIGDKIVEDYTYTYPHNIILEILMSVGLIGFIPFFMANLIAIRKFFNLMRNNNLIVALLFFYMVIGAMVSGGIITSPDYWMSFILILAVRT